ncbi:MAG: cell division protein ZapA [Oscillibacter sp.]|jgi:cell division protein ZapA|nr:cell division protein ZapA [Oscillibacter sp.]
MENRVVVNIGGEEYALIAEENASYIQKVGSYVDQKLQAVLNSTHAGRADAAVLTATNLADELFKEQAASEQLRGQIKQYLDETKKAQNEASELRREVVRLRQRLENRGENGNS